jgi:subtilisin family serine protease
MRVLSTWWGVGFSIVLCALALAHSQASINKKQHKPVAEFVQGEAVVQLKKHAKSDAGRFATRAEFKAYGVMAQALQNSLSRKYIATVKQFRTDPSLLKVKVQGAAAMPELLADIQANSQVQFAEPNFIYHTFDNTARVLDEVQGVIPNDPGFTQTWAMLNTGQADPKGQIGAAGVDIGATKAWALGTGSKDIVVAVIDTGVDYTHEDLANNVFVNTKETAGDGKDDDGNGFVDDVHGWNFAANTNDPLDDHSHGSHCSGTIGGEGNNGIGVAGVNWHVSILPVKFLTAEGSGTLDGAVESIKYATKMGANVMSNSWGGGGFSQTMLDAIKEAKDKGILFVAAAGNDGNNNDANPSYPASYDVDNVIAVAATDNNDQKASWSNYGQRTVHLAAPGVNIYSSLPMKIDTYGNKYGTMSGTSMACPHVSGAAALLWSLNKDMKYSDIKARLLATVDPVRGLKKKTVSGGRLNINNAVRNIVPPRNEPPADQWKSVVEALESVHPYGMNTNQTFEVSHPGAHYIRLHFTKVETENGYDFVTVKDAAGKTVEELTGTMADYTTDYVEGDKLTITITSDNSVDGFGFAVDHYDFIE